MKHSRILFTGVILLIATVSLSAQRLLLNQAYLSQFPSVESLRAAAKNADEVDSYARFMAALTVINDVMIHDLVTEPHGGRHLMPPAAERVQERYRRALSSLDIDSPEPPSRDPRFRPLRAKYEKDPAFLDSLLLKFFTPQFRADYYAWVRRPIPASTAANTANTASADPSIAKAKAAKVDITLFAGSIKFGDALHLPSCPYEQTIIGINMRRSTTQDCVETPSAVGGFAGELVELIGAMVPPDKRAAPDPDLKQIFLVENHRPSWMSGESVWLRTYGGSIVRVVIPTKGRIVENRVAEELRAKYGPTVLANDGTVTPDEGNAFKVRNLEWFLPGMHVEYRVIEVDENGRVKIDGPGYVRIETDSAYRRRIAEEKKKEQEKRVL